MTLLTEVVWPIVAWWFVVTVVGWSALPFVRRVLGALPDEGLAFMRPLGLLFAGFIYWLAVMAGLVPNTRAGAVFLLLLIAAIGGWFGYQDRESLSAFLRTRRRLIVGHELLFFGALTLWALYRAYHPDIESAGGEKYMEMAFINAVIRSPRFPPLDPWLSGYSISYYYFGYILAGWLTQVTGVLSSIAFNLVIPMTWAMTLGGAFGLGYNLVGLSERATSMAKASGGAATAVALGVIGSLEGAVELAYLRKWAGEGFFKWLDVKDLVPGGNCGEAANTFYGAGGWVPTRFIWWWRGSRVILDSAGGNCNEIIHEFPFFSFMLSDVHPHVVALPYVLTCLAIALAVLAGALETWPGRPFWSPRWLVLPFVVGALGFLNTWDLPTYGFILVALYALRTAARPAWVPRVTASEKVIVGLGFAGLLAAGWRIAPELVTRLTQRPPDAQPAITHAALALALAMSGLAAVYGLWLSADSGSSTARRALDVLRFGTWLVALSIAFYLPFYVGFSSQASGLSIVTTHTRFQQWLVHFGFLFFLAVSVLAMTLSRMGRSPRHWSLAGWTVLAVAAPFALAALRQQAWTAVILSICFAAAGLLAVEGWLKTVPPDEAMPLGEDEAADGEVPADGEMPADADAQTDEYSSPRPDKVSHRRTSSAAVPAADETGAPEVLRSLPVAPTFVLVCVAVGFLLPLGTEFLFIKDIFGARMNTMFKLYYQAWTLLAVGGGYTVYLARRVWPKPLAAAWAVPAALLLAASMIYPLASIYTRTNSFHADVLTLDGLHWWEAAFPDDLATVRWLQANVAGAPVVLQANGGGYAHEYRLAMATGLPTVLGSDLHEWQWRGTQDFGTQRGPDVEKIYKTTSLEELGRLLDLYHVRYLVVGDMERNKFNLKESDLNRYRQVMRPVFQSGSTQVFGRD